MAKAQVAIPSSSELRKLYTSGGYVLTRQITRRIGASMVGPAYRLNLTPNQVSALHLLIAGLVSAAVIGVYREQPVLAAILALVGWHFACGLDSTDGILARATGQITPEGNVVDQLCDLVRTTIIVATGWYLIPASGLELEAGWQTSFLPALTTGGWLMPVFFIGVARSSQMKTGMDTLPLPLLVARNIRDTALHITALALAIAIGGYAILAVLLGVSIIQATAIGGRMAKYVISRPGN